MPTCTLVLISVFESTMLCLCFPSGPGGRRNKSSRFLGVSKKVSKGKVKWHARAKIGQGDKDLGYYSDEEEAARAYDAAVVKLNRNTNFPVAGTRGMQQHKCGCGKAH